MIPASAPLFRTLTRPHMFAGVTYGFLALNIGLTTESVLITHSLLALPIALLIHVACVLACRREPRIFDLWLTRVRRCPRVANWRRWGCNSYRP